MSAIIDLNHLSCLKVSGDQAKALLQGQLTCDLNEISPTQSRLGAHCNPQGRVLSFFRIFNHDNSYFLLMPRDILPLALATLNKYAIFYKLKPIVSDELKFIGFIGQPSRQLFARLPLIIDEVIQQSDINIVKIQGPEHCYLIFSRTDSFENIWNTLKKDNKILTFDEWKLINIQHKIPSVSSETTGKFLPHELFLQDLNAISFHKGCYTGQEIIARMQYRGKLKYQLLVSTITTYEKIFPGQDIYDATGKISGTVVDTCQPTANTYSLLISTSLSQNIFLDIHGQLPLTL